MRHRMNREANRRPRGLRSGTLVGVVLSLLAACAYVRLAHAQAEAGYVLEVQGAWFLERNTAAPLRKAESLPAGARIFSKAPEGEDYIIIAGLDGEIAASRNCSRDADCGRPFTVPTKRRKESGLVSEVLETAMRLIWGAPNRYSVHRVRGDMHELREAVAPLERGRADLSAVFRSMPGGTYSVTLRPLAEGDDDGGGAVQTKFDWAPGTDTSLEAGGLAPGLYELKAAEKRVGSRSQTTHVAWVLLAEGKQLPRLAKSFGRAQALTDKWGASVEPYTKRGFLRACLEHLSATRAK